MGMIVFNDPVQRCSISIYIAIGLLHILSELKLSKPQQIAVSSTSFNMTAVELLSFASK